MIKRLNLKSNILAAINAINEVLSLNSIDGLFQYTGGNDGLNISVGFGRIRNGHQIVDISAQNFTLSPNKTYQVCVDYVAEQLVAVESNATTTDHIPIYEISTATDEIEAVTDLRNIITP